MKYWTGFLTAGIIGAVTWALMRLAEKFSELVDMVYPYVSRTVLSFLAQWSSTVDFTLWQMAAVLLGVVLAASIVLMIVMRWNPLRWLGWVLAAASLIYFLNTLAFGLNYYAGPLAEDIRLEVRQYDAEELSRATIYYRDKANFLAQQVKRDANGDLVFDDFDTLAEKAENGFHNLVYKQSFPVFAGSTIPVKKLGWSDMYTSMGITGVTFGLTGEAAVNPQIPNVTLPFTMCHEMAHRMCIATEDDANFAAFLASLANEDPQFVYSAYYMAYRYCHQALLDLGTGRATATAAQIDKDVNAYLRYDLNVYDRFFADHHNGLATSVAEKANDAYIKLSGDDNGTESYGRVAVDLVNWYLEVIVKPKLEGEAEPSFDPLDKDFIHGILGGQE